AHLAQTKADFKVTIREMTDSPTEHNLQSDHEDSGDQACLTQLKADHQVTTQKKLDSPTEHDQAMTNPKVTTREKEQLAHQGTIPDDQGDETNKTHLAQTTTDFQVTIRKKTDSPTEHDPQNNRGNDGDLSYLAQMQTNHQVTTRKKKNPLTEHDQAMTDPKVTTRAKPDSSDEHDQATFMQEATSSSRTEREPEWCRTARAGLRFLRGQGRARMAMLRLRDLLRECNDENVQAEARRHLPGVLEAGRMEAHPGEEVRPVACEEWTDTIFRRLGGNSLGAPPGERLPFGIFHAAYIWPNGSYSTRDDLARAGRLDLLGLEGDRTVASSSSTSGMGALLPPAPAGDSLEASNRTDEEDQHNEDEEEQEPASLLSLTWPTKGVLLLPMMGSSFDEPWTDQPAPTWWWDAVDELRSLMDRGVDKHKLGNLLEQGLRGRGDERMTEENLLYTNGLLRAMWLHSDHVQPPLHDWKGPPTDEDIGDLIDWILHRIKEQWYWKVCPVAMTHRAEERELEDIGYRGPHHLSDAKLRAEREERKRWWYKGSASSSPLRGKGAHIGEPEPYLNVLSDDLEFVEAWWSDLHAALQNDVTTKSGVTQTTMEQTTEVESPGPSSSSTPGRAEQEEWHDRQEEIEFEKDKQRWEEYMQEKKLEDQLARAAEAAKSKACREWDDWAMWDELQGERVPLPESPTPAISHLHVDWELCYELEVRVKVCGTVPPARLGVPQNDMESGHSRCGTTTTRPQMGNGADSSTVNVTTEMDRGGMVEAGTDVDNQVTIPWGCDGGDDTVNSVELAECEAFAADLAKEYEYREAQAEAQGAVQKENVR
ncbi:unnamed protein product, partial [Symbiodinium sp. CCMP2456]